ncbi:Protein of unknown function [Evansella caseinilytica]|uniref:DUF2512 family protein n=1 Tax=Evansella caseinilytica TaxID=1503961 RepID=A0A1H3M9N6_9BACI|nr:DUF2512 family protein [Evansella caseinilytica]SDY73457.1 Protein of unknown function [Evansella caseinilytica]
MLKHLFALAVKFVIVATVTLSFLSLFDVPFMWILFVTILMIIPAYILGDLIVYPKYGHLAAAVADFSYYLLALWLVLFAFVDGTTASILNAASATVFITFVEALYHEFVIGKMLKLKTAGTPLFKQTPFSTEFAEEIDVKADMKKKK